MGVARADANGAGSAGAVGSVGTVRPDQAPVPARDKTAPGVAGGQSTKWSVAPTQSDQNAPAAQETGSRAQTAPLDLRRIDAAYDWLVEKEGELALADRNRGKQRYSSASETEYKIATDKRDRARAKLAGAISAEEARLSRPSSIFPGDRAADRMQVDARLIRAYAGDKQSHIRDVIWGKQRERVIAGLRHLSAAMRQGSLTGPQKSERDEILADASSWVTMPRPSDGSDREQVQAAKRTRLDFLLKDLTRKNENIEGTLLKRLVIDCATAASSYTSERELKGLRSIVSAYRHDGNDSKADGWIDEVDQWVEERIKVLRSS